MMRRAFLFSLIATAIGTSLGCRQEPVAEFEPNMVYAKAIEINTGYPMEQALDETQVALTRFFGTPDEPRLPDVITEDDEYASLVSLDNLKLAAGPITDAGGGLYRRHCSTCHGVVGNGRGAAAALSNPYPRDYRMGKFKYKSTTRSAKPLREDLAYVIKNGIAGTAMQKIPELTDDDIQALVDYVIYLSMRGELERSLLMEGEEVVFEDGESLFNEASPEFEDQLEFAQDTLLDIADSWLEADDRIKEVPEPEGVPVPDTIEELRTALAQDGDSEIKQSVARGHEVFLSELAACAKCHGAEGRGDGQTQDYDDWTKDYTVRVDLDPTDLAELVPLIARGALPPRKILPRDFREGLFRGGSEPSHIFLRIAAGIDGTPMPAATIPEEDIWHLVNYVRSVAEPPTEEPVEAETPLAANAKPSM
jgi:mono/diheme cytochrome c family protein